MISIVVGYRNREFERVKRSIDSLSVQSFKKFELIFVDYGSEPEIASTIKDLVSSYSFANYLYVDTIGMFWNRAHALNIGTRYSSGDILLYYDIDLILSKTFLETLVTKDFIHSFYTFSSFYLNPEHNYLNDISKIIDNLKYSYVGLSAVSRRSIDLVGGFDEFYMIWGVEDDDLYQKLSTNGIKRVELGYPEYNVYHQFHKIESPDKPNLWYLTMLNHFHKKNFNIKFKSSSDFIVDRPAKNALKNGSYENHKKLMLNNNRSILLYNNFMYDFYNLASNKLCWFEYRSSKNNQNFKKIKLFIYSFLNINSKNISKKGYSFLRNDYTPSLQEVHSFLSYFIGINRNIILDYCLDIRDQGIRLVIIRK